MSGDTLGRALPGKFLREHGHGMVGEVQAATLLVAFVCRNPCARHSLVLANAHMSPRSSQRFARFGGALIRTPLPPSTWWPHWARIRVPPRG
ncbi:hypothetical protein [Sinimarinibacterium sp. NLF-5-8]|uniref:hypothetical protein n=1 Tax=Sinimarinibacterium sp. NLF-5-8 TaxID=2698684 RepID=UPI00137C0C74|nr:hypothetical protein [Sinimarinibacterium sp. NLF-5-8]QHS09807.1 hypothetical protein GT972_06310 [Sinimarinibacterium sp. NLF-5-8]